MVVLYPLAVGHAMDLAALQVFLAVAAERSFSRAAAKLHRTQPAVSQAVRRLEDELGERLFDRSSKEGTLTEAGRVLRNYAQRLVRLAEEAESAVRELRDLRRGRVLIGANEAAVHTLLPLIGRFRSAHPHIQSTSAACRRGRSASRCSRAASTSARDVPSGRARAARRCRSAPTSSCMLVPPSHPLAGRKQVTMAEFGRETVIAHNDPSPARERVLRLFEQQHVPLNIGGAAEPRGIKRAVEMKLGVALLPRRCAITEIARGQLVGGADAAGPSRTAGAAGLPARRRAVARGRRVSRGGESSTPTEATRTGHGADKAEG